jgi:hypothetical protein
MKIRRTFYTPKMRMNQRGARVEVFSILDGGVRYHAVEFAKAPRDQAQVVKMIRTAHREVLGNPASGIPMN